MALKESAGRKPKRGLGKGLDAMIKQNEVVVENTTPNKAEVMIKITEIEPNKEQPRKRFDEDSLLELSESIKQFGIVQPLIIQKKGKRYEIIAGERRWRAAMKVGLKEVPAIIKDYTPEEAMAIALIENIQREDLNPIEEALAYQNLIDELHLKQEEVAERVSKSRATITNSLRLLKLSGPVQQMLIEEIISSGHAKVLLSLEDTSIQEEVATRILDEKLSVRETEKLVKSLNNKKNEKNTKKKENEVSDANLKEIENKISSVIGTKVSINQKGKKGKIEIEYYTMEEFERIYDLLTTIKK